MAGDWIKFEVATSDKPEVWAIADALLIDPDAVVGKLLRVWAWFDQQTESGNAPSVTKALLDRAVGVTDFCQTVINVGWMVDDGKSITLPNFDRHNGTSAKKRAETNRRVAKHREVKRDCNAGGNANCNTNDVTKSVTREEKRREEKEKNNDLFSDFPEFWGIAIKKIGKDGAERAYLKALKKVSHETIIKAWRLANEAWQGKERKWIPKPANWLKDGSWDDEFTADEETGQLEKTSEFVGTHPDAEMNLWKIRIKSFREREFWVGMYGPTPDEPDCEAPAELLKAYREGKAHD